MPAHNSRNVSLTDEHQALVDRLVSSGRYATASEVVRAALRVLERDEHQRLLEKWLAEGLTKEEEAQLSPDMLERARVRLSNKIREGLESIRQGDVIDADEFFANWRTRLEDRRRSSKSRRSA